MDVLFRNVWSLLYIQSSASWAWTKSVESNSKVILPFKVVSLQSLWHRNLFLKKLPNARTILGLFEVEEIIKFSKKSFFLFIGM